MIERKITVYIYDLALPTRVKNALVRKGIMTLNDLEKDESRDFSTIRGIGEDGIQAIKDILDNIDTVYKSFETKSEQVNALSDDLRKTKIDKLPISVRAYNALYRSGIHNIGDLVIMSSQDIFKLRNIGTQTRDEICRIIDDILAYQDEALEKITMIKNDETLGDPEEDEQTVADIAEQGKGFDFDVIGILTDSFFMKPSRMAGWFDMSRQGIYDALSKRSLKRKQKWTGYAMENSEEKQLLYMIQNKCLEYKDENGVLCYCFNNRCDDLAAIFVYTDKIKCYFLRDMPKELQESLIHANMHRYTKKELEGAADGSIVSIIKKHILFQIIQMDFGHALK